MKNLVGGHFVARRAKGGVVEDLLFFPHLVLIHGVPSVVALDPAGLKPPIWMACKP